MYAIRSYYAVGVAVDVGAGPGGGAEIVRIEVAARLGDAVEGHVAEDGLVEADDQRSGRIQEDPSLGSEEIGLRRGVEEGAARQRRAESP